MHPQRSAYSDSLFSLTVTYVSAIGLDRRRVQFIRAHDGRDNEPGGRGNGRDRQGAARCWPRRRRSGRRIQNDRRAFRNRKRLWQQEEIWVTFLVQEVRWIPPCTPTMDGCCGMSTCGKTALRFCERDPDCDVGFGIDVHIAGCSAMLR
jgi:hypothetical protein